MLQLPVYMDNHATTRVDPRVVEAMLPYFTEKYGNAGSTSHVFGWEARDAVAAARESIAVSIGATDREIVFTSGATESNNLAIRGVAERSRRRGSHIVSVVTEHKAVLDPLARLSRRGYEVTLLPVEKHGTALPGSIAPRQVFKALRDDTILCSVMLANNEIGLIHPLAEIAKYCAERGVPLHCDATQAVGKIPVDVEKLGIDMMSFSAHKIYGPKGVGALYVRRGAAGFKIESQVHGGGQEHGLRSGTLNVAGIVGFAKAVELAVAELPTEAPRLAQLRKQLYDALVGEVPDLQLNGPALEAATEAGAPLRLPGNLNCSFPLVDGEALLMSMQNLAVSSSSACTSANPEPSHVLRAMGLSEDLTRASLRFGLGRFNTAEEVEFAVRTVGEAVDRLRKLSSMA